MKIHVDRDRELAILDHQTASTRQEVEEAVRALHAHPRHVGGMLTLHDCRRVDFSRMRSAELLELVHALGDARLVLARRAAIVVARDVDFGVSRMWDRYAAAELPQERRVFRDLDDAIAWLRDDAEAAGSEAAS